MLMPPLPSFDTWTIVFLFAATQGLFVALVLWRWRQGHLRANRLLALLLVLFSVTMIEYVLFWTHYLGRFPHLAELSAHFPLLYGPIVWLYLRSIYTGRPLSRRDAAYLIPFLLATAVFLPWYGLDAATKRTILLGQGHFPVSRQVLFLIQWLRILHLTAYALWNFWYIRRQPVLGATTRWATLLNGFYIGFLLAYAAYFVLVRFSFFNTAWDYHISAAMAAFVYLIAYAGYVQPAVFEGFSLTEAAAVAKYKNSGLTAEASRSLLQKLDGLMAVEKLYRNPALGLDALAARLEASKHHVSQVINAYRNANFFEYLNQLRIEEAKELLAETTRDDLHVIEVAYAVGFNNKVSFNTTFKKITGLTPTAYRKSHGRTDSGGEPVQGQAP
ncbi:MAG: helix-turn-helix domain-containing protein [Saprospiraceae bacterium]